MKDDATRRLPARPAAHERDPRDRREEPVSPWSSPTSSTPSCRPRPSSAACNINIPGSGCSTSVVASACAYAGQGPFTLLHGRQRRERAGHGVGHARGRDRPHRLARLRRRLVLQRRSRARACAASAAARSASRGGMGVYTKCAIKLGPSFGADRLAGRRHVPAYRSAAGRDACGPTRSPSPTWDAWADVYYKIYDNEIGYIFHRQFNLAGAELAPAFWLMYNDHTKTLCDVPGTGRAAGDARSSRRRCASPSRSSSAGRSEGRHRAAGPDPRRDPRGGRRLEGRALLRAGHGRVHQHVPAAARATSTSTSSGPAATSAAGCRSARPTGSRATCRRPRPASSATPRTACSCSAAATP